MNEKLTNYLKTIKIKEKLEKDKILITAGLYEKDYEHGVEDTLAIKNHLRFYYGEEIDSSNKTYHFKKIPIKVTDEEFSIISKQVAKDAKNEETFSGISAFLTILGILTYVAGSIYILYAFCSEIRFLVFPVLISTLFVGTLLIGLSKIINLLCEIKDCVK